MQYTAIFTMQFSDELSYLILAQNVDCEDLLELNHRVVLMCTIIYVLTKKKKKMYGIPL